MATNDELKKLQSASMLMKSASLASKTVAKSDLVPASRNSNSIAPAPQGIRVAFFFDGTGNNLDADIGHKEHSNVARLYRAHPDNDTTLGIFRYYIPGIGTRFKDIGDPGGETLGLAFGGKGQARLDWAMSRLEERFVQSKGRKLHLALFGFSRGAALARAFARLVTERCERGGKGEWHFTHNKTRYPVRLYFMGLFDTVASVGAPMGTNNLQSLDLTTGVLNLKQALQTRHLYGSTLDDIAFASGGAPGADPASGMANGHMSWADDLRVPDMVEDCLHMVAAHEVRNSFPVDSVLQNLSYPSNCRERVYPGAHSDVGGGYRQGEGARSQTAGSMLSLIPLRQMRAEALKAGVPLMSQMPTQMKGDFAEDPASKSAYETLCRRFDHYMQAAGRGGKPVGTLMLSHMKLYYQWRFYKIARNQSNRASNKVTEDQAILVGLESQWEKEKKASSDVWEKARSEAKAHQFRVMQMSRSETVMFGAGQKRLEAELKLASQKEDAYLAEKARYDTMPSSDGSFVRNSKIYDEQLLEDARKLQALAKKKGRDKLRPHYRAILDAYEAQSKGNGLRDQEIIAFFDTYVHDSLTGFAKDATLPSDPRVIYIGGDEKLPYAMNQPSQRDIPTSALA
jgi:hypothetical protein